MIWHNSGMVDVMANLPPHLTTAYALLLNPMTDRTEAVRLVAVSDNRSELESLLTSEKVEPYSDDGRWRKVYRQGGPLEWFNAPDGIYDGTGIAELRRDGWRRVA
jgi:hypothetical protein